jgi:hypothetical protein
MFFFIVVCPSVLFLLAIVLSVLLRYTDSDYPFGIFKLFLLLHFHHWYITQFYHLYKLTGYNMNVNDI